MAAPSTSRIATQPAMICRRTRFSRAFSFCCSSAMRALRSWLTGFLGTVILVGARGYSGGRRCRVLHRGTPKLYGFKGGILCGRLRETVSVTDLQLRRWTPGRPLDVLAVIGDLRRGPGDPTFRRDPDGTIWRGIRTPQGASTLRLGLAGGPGIEATAWGPGAEWVLTSVPAMLGEQDDATGFVAHHPKVAEAARRFSGWRVPRTGLVLEALVPSILEQKV